MAARQEPQDPQAQLSRAVAPKIIASGQFSSNGAAKQITATVTPCSYIWLGATVDANGNATNTKPMWVGDASNQYLTILHTDVKGVFFGIAEASDVYIIGTNGEKLNYVIFG